MKAASVLGREARARPSERLIDRGLTALEVSASGLAERYTRGRTAHSGQVWWARRPHAAMRALVFAILSADTSPRARQLLIDLASESGDLEALYAEARTMLASGDGPPVIVDPFSGGGTIPHEAAALGAQAYSLDYNGLASFVQRVNLDYAQRAFATLGKARCLAMLRDAGRQVIAAAGEATAHLFPARHPDDANRRTIVYIWTYRHACSSCGFDYHVSRRPWLSKKSGREASIGFAIDGHRQLPFVARGEALSPSRLADKEGFFRCPACGTKDPPSITDCRDSIVAVAQTRGRGHRDYVADDARGPALVPEADIIERFCDDALREIGCPLPTSTMPHWSGIANPSLYGLARHGDIFNPRQRAVCLAIICEIRRAYARIAASAGIEAARYIAGALGGLIDQLVDWNCRLSMWISQNEQVGRAFCGPGISMLWDYAETDAFGDGPANLTSKLDRIVKAAEAIPIFQAVPMVAISPAQALPLADGSVDAVITDPPYYDNIFYNVLADNFYAWKRLAYRDLFPECFAAEMTGSERELVASRNRQGSSLKAHDWYCRELAAAVAEMARIVKPDGTVAMVYGHSSLLGWDAIVRAFRGSGLTVRSMEPLAIERRHRPRAMTSEAVNTCVVIVARKDGVGRRTESLSDFQSILASQALAMIADLRAAGWAGQDIGMAAFAIGVGLLASIEGVEDHGDMEVLKLIGDGIHALVPDFKMSKRGAI